MCLLLLPACRSLQVSICVLRGPALSDSSHSIMRRACKGVLPQGAQSQGTKAVDMVAIITTFFLSDCSPH